HLGSRQAEVQIAEGQVRYRQDPVLDDMVRRLGFEIRAEQAPFEPETDTNVPT
ncbi:MAG: hypothetical protein HKP58_11180, partial [Desulfatitalea sp.]|nr:hypothetical protein [Desulfatitalea sp.]NNK00964.1 hypothetical protein [Desulfatitalea sp.]